MPAPSSPAPDVLLVVADQARRSGSILDGLRLPHRQRPADHGLVDAPLAPSR